VWQPKANWAVRVFAGHSGPSSASPLRPMARPDLGRPGRTVRLWDVASGQPQKVLSPGDSMPPAVAEGC